MKSKKHTKDTSKATAAIIQMRKDREARGIFPARFMRLFLTDDAFRVTEKMDNAEFRRFVSDAVVRLAKKRRLAIAKSEKEG